MSRARAPQTEVFDDAVGWVALFGFLTEAEVHDVLGACRSLLDLPSEERHVRDKVVAGTRHLYELDERSSLVDTILDRQRLVDVVGDILGSTFRRDEVAYRSPQPSFGGQRLHADDPPKLDAGRATVATAIITLTEFSATNGATRVIPGSHHRVDLQRTSGSLENHPEEIRLTGPAGTAFVFSGHLLHSGTANESDDERPALQVVWRR